MPKQPRKSKPKPEMVSVPRKALKFVLVLAKQGLKDRAEGRLADYGASCVRWVSDAMRKGKK